MTNQELIDCINIALDASSEDELFDIWNENMGTEKGNGASVSMINGASALFGTEQMPKMLR